MTCCVDGTSGSPGRSRASWSTQCATSTRTSRPLWSTSVRDLAAVTAARPRTLVVDAANGFGAIYRWLRRAVTGSLLIVTGPPGAGKSTVCALLAARFEPSALVEGDAFFGFLAGGAVAPWMPDANRQNEVVTRAAAAATGRFVDGGYRTVYDGVVGPWFLPVFVAASGLAELHYAVLLPTADRCVERVARRVGHGFADEAATRKMHEEFSAANVDERHVLPNPPGAPEAIADGVLLRLADGSLVYRP